jgi:hypothetical protein
VCKILRDWCCFYYINVLYLLKYYPRALMGNFGVRGKEYMAFGELENIE